jgi:hypothetical protein
MAAVDASEPFVTAADELIAMAADCADPNDRLSIWLAARRVSEYVEQLRAAPDEEEVLAAPQPEEADLRRGWHQP